MLTLGVSDCFFPSFLISGISVSDLGEVV